MFCKVFLLKVLFLAAVYTHQDELPHDDNTVIEPFEDSDDERGEYSDIWAVQLAGGANPDEVARVNGFRNKGPINEKEGFYEFVHRKSSPLRKRRLSRRHEQQAHLRLSDHPHVKWFERQRYLHRVKRSVVLNDPQLPYEWYIHNTGKHNTGLKGFDLNILPVWEMGYTGKGVKVSVLDDGLDHTHPDIKANYDPHASYDFNGEDPDPFPRDSDPYNAHGTKCSGEIAAVANNSICGVGVAFNAGIGAVRMLDGKATDALEAKSLGFRNDYIDIYSCSWGPKDDGKTFGRPGKLAKAAFIKGATEGRKGKGNIYVWATGNGGLVGDDCNCDGYTTSIYTLSIGAISDHGLSTYYDEKCSSTVAVVFTADSHRGTTFTNDKLITTGLHHQCETTFRGTSSAAPLAAGIIALLLEANPNLTWRDVQHIVVNTSKKTSPLDEGWKRNGVGREFNHKFGFGRMDALAMVKAGLKWKNVPLHHICQKQSGKENIRIPYHDTVPVYFTVTGCRGQANEVRKLEHVDITLTLRHPRRGNLNITVVSPMGTSSNLLSPRRYDDSNKGLKEWAFMTVHFWGEDPAGKWTLYIRDQYESMARRGEDNEDRYRKLLDERKANRARDFIPGAYDFMHDEVHHGRYKEDYMRDEIPEDTKRNPWEFSEDFRDQNGFISSRKHTPSGYLLKWKITLYGTDS